LADLIFQVAVGEVPPFYHQCINSVARYAERIGADHMVIREPVLRIAPLASCRSENALRLGYLPIYEKEGSYAFLESYSRICVIDADIFVRKSAPNIFDELGDYDFAAVVERELPSVPDYAEKVRKHSQGQFSTLTDVDWKWNGKGAHYYNMGMMLFGNNFKDYLNGQTPTEFLRRPEFARFVNGESHWKWSTDQSLLNWWVKKSGMRTRDLDWRWNGMYKAVKDHDAAHFVHFFLYRRQAEGAIESLISNTLR